MKTRLQELRVAAGFTSAKAFAEQYGFSVGSYTNYEQGMSGMSLKKLWELADIFDVSLDYLVGRDYEQEREAEQPEIMAAYEKLDETGKAYATASVRGMAERMEA